MREKKNKASRGHGGIVYERGLSERLAGERQRKTLRKLARLSAHPKSLTAAQAGWLGKLRKRTPRPAPPAPHELPPVETLQ